MDLAQNLHLVQERIAAACASVGREPSSVTLLAVTKSHPPEVVNQAAKLGITVFAENKVQEAKAKIPLCPSRLRWQMIGHLQTNKCRDAVELFELIQSVDSLRLAEELSRRAQMAAKTLPILFEVNIVGEATKFGYAPDRLVAELDQLRRLPRLEVQGLMSIPPWSPTPERSRAVFRRLRELKTECERVLDAPLPHLSMGMSSDYQVAVQEGATMVRIGTALFGERPKRPAAQDF